MAKLTEDLTVEQEAQAVMHMSNKLHDLFMESGMTRSVCFAAIGNAIAETYGEDTEKIQTAIRQIVQFAGLAIPEIVFVDALSTEGSC
jgi:copper chaperone CopZ